MHYAESQRLVSVLFVNPNYTAFGLNNIISRRTMRNASTQYRTPNDIKNTAQNNCVYGIDFPKWCFRNRFPNIEVLKSSTENRLYRNESMNIIKVRNHIHKRDFSKSIVCSRFRKIEFMNIITSGAY